MDNKKIKKHNSLRRQTVIIIASVAAFALLCTLYFAVLRPMLNVRKTAEYDMLDGEAISTNGCELISSEGDGEVSVSDDGKTAVCRGGNARITLDITDGTATAGRFYMFPAVEAEQVDRLEVTNPQGSYGFYYDISDAQYYLINYKGTPYEKSAFTALIAAARNPFAIERVTVSADDLSVYGLEGEGDNAPAQYTLTDKSGEVHTVLVGSMIPTGGGYYCMVQGRPAVYILDTTMSAFGTTAESFVTPLLSFPISDTEYYTTEVFTLKVDGETYISCGYMTEAEREKTASTSTYKMFVPENYTPSTSNYGKLLQTFVSFKGTEVLAFGEYGGKMDAFQLAKYKLAAPKYEIYYRYKNVDNYVYVSEQNEDGSYYAYSLLFNIVARVDADTLGFLRWDFIDFIDKPLFQKNINDVASIRIEAADGLDETWAINGDSNENLSVTPQSDGKALSADGIENFRHLYIKLLGLAIEEYTDTDSTDEWSMRMSISTDYGMEYVYDFYNYSTRRCFFTINGKGEFYCLRDRVEQIVSDAHALMNGENVDASVTG